MPFTTMSDYNWLFDVNISHVNEIPESHDVDTGICGPSPDFMNTDYIHDSSGPDIIYRQDHQQSPTQVTAEHQPGSQRGQRQRGVPTHCDIPTLYDDTSPSMNSTSVRPSTSSGGHMSPTTIVTRSVNLGTSTQHYHQQATPTVHNLSHRLDTERPMGLLNQGNSLPKFDALARSQILDLVISMSPLTPDGQPMTSDHPLLSLTALQRYSDLFFSCFNTAYPLLHLPTFDLCKVDTLLLLSILLLGATYCEADAHQFAVSTTDSHEVQC